MDEGDTEDDEGGGSKRIIRVVIGRVIRSSAEGTRSYNEANNALIFR